MKKYLIFGLLIAASLFTALSAQERELADVWPAMRVPNYYISQKWNPLKRRWEPIGSCAHAAAATMLRWHGYEDIGKWWEKTYHSGENSCGLIEKFENSGIDFAYTYNGNEKFLEWCGRNRKVAVIFFKTKHAVVLIDFTDTHAVIIDNNKVNEYQVYDRADFVKAWQERYGGFALALQSPPPPPWPTQRRQSR